MYQLFESDFPFQSIKYSSQKPFFQDVTKIYRKKKHFQFEKLIILWYIVQIAIWKIEKVTLK